MLRHIFRVKTTVTLFHSITLRRAYHSEKGVFGYRPRPKRQFKVSDEILQSRNAQSNVYRWVEAYRKHGHKFANVNPISIKGPQSPLDELNPAFYGLEGKENVKPQGLLNAPELETTTTTVDELELLLKQIYCGNAVSAEFAYIEITNAFVTDSSSSFQNLKFLTDFSDTLYICDCLLMNFQDLEEREWLSKHFEQLKTQTVSNDTRKQIAELLIKSQAWDNFMAIKFPTVKRYGGEGAETLLAFFWQLLRDSVQVDLTHLVVAMSHRGRTALQTIMLNMRPAKVFRKLRGESEFPKDCQAMSDVISHFHTSEDLNVDGKAIHFTMVRNPSHLEAGNPVSMGKTRSKQQTVKDGSFNDDDPTMEFSSKVLNVILHGDAAFAGQGVNQECLNTAYVPHYEIGGSLHVLINNQVGFTTPGERGRSTDYASDLAKTIQAPVFHVNGDNPEMLIQVTKLAFAYQRQFRKDVFIDLNCFRRWGHNELDDPTFTNPLIRTIYLEYLNAELAVASEYEPEPSYFQKQWQHITSASSDCVTYWDTGLDYGLLNYIGQQSVTYPDSFNIHPHLQKIHIETRRNKLNAGEKIDWSTAEALAIGSLMYQGYNIRLSGEDVGRGTFSHRHAMLIDQQNNEMYIPLNDLKGGLGGKLEIANSILSEEAVLGFEYGMAIDNPDTLIIWEAQFGDFANGAQIIIDNFIISGETKWMDSNALVMLLPHGYDGAASEHSSCRIERFLQLCDSKECESDGDHVNVNIVNPTTPAQYYHVLRRQLLRNFRKPLVVVAPKILLRLPAATSTHVDFHGGTNFQNVLPDVTVQPNDVQRIILCSGKHYYALADERKAQQINNTAIIRLESLCPFPLLELQQQLAKYKNAKAFVWSQEEHRNMGAWNFVKPRFENLVGKPLLYCGRVEAPTSATGVGKIHKQEVEEVVCRPFQL
uniref:Transketolase-like pyrimidine-binding domain-containing protein n=1 Tax=Glossina brevipalpis TaxID=37001 RepID=A0A1A9WZ17_9MUSC